MPRLLPALALLALIGCGGDDPGAAGAKYVGLATVYGASDVAYAAVTFGRIRGSACPLRRTLGACVILDCTAATSDEQSGLDAGTVELSGATLDSTVVGSYFAEVGPFPYDQELTLKVSGSKDVSAYELLLSAPAELSLLEPATTGVLDLDRSVGLVTRWTPAGTGNVGVQLTVAEDGSSTILECSALVGEGSLVIPSEALSELPLPSETGSATITIGANDSLVERRGDWELWLMANAYVLSASVTLR